MTDALIKSIEINKYPVKTVKDINANKLIKALATHLKEKNIIKPMKYVNLVKCSKANDLQPYDSDYIYEKAAAICRTLYFDRTKTLGVGKLRVIFGMKKRRGAQPPKFFKAGGAIIRGLVKQLKEQGYLDNYKANEYAIETGLYLTSHGQSELDKIAKSLV